MPKPIYLSASRIDTFLTCSQLYYAKYVVRIPDPGNDGSNRGTVVHETLELLAKPKHKKHYDAAINAGTCKDVNVLWKFIKKLAAKYKVSDDSNLKMIDGFIMVALQNNFFGPKGTEEVIVEKDFSVQVNEDGKKYNLRGVIDRIFKIKDGKKIYTEGQDFKTSKDVFKKEKLDDNAQSLIYQIAIRKLFPEAILRRFHFLFLKFPKEPVQEQPIFTEDQLNGYEQRLTDYQKAMENFTTKDAEERLAIYNEEKKWLCGSRGIKKDGSKKWICPAQEPLDFFVLLDEEGEFIASAFTEAELHPKDGQIVLPRRYNGCPAFYNPKTGLRRNFS